MPEHPFVSSLVNLSRHAEARMRQRGIDQEVVDLIIGNHDAELPVGDGRHEVRISRRTLVALMADGIAPRLADRARTIALVLAPDGTVVTVKHLYANAGRRGVRRRSRFQSRPHGLGRHAWPS